jgi:hypothetical protein
MGQSSFAMTRGFDAHFTKPANPDQIRKLVAGR